MLILVYINNGLQTSINVFLEPLGLVHFRGIVSYYTTIKDIGQPNNNLFLWEFSDKVDQPISVIIIHHDYSIQPGPQNTTINTSLFYDGISSSISIEYRLLPRLVALLFSCFRSA